MKFHEITFPRHSEDIASRKRTLAHLPCVNDAESPFAVCDAIVMRGQRKDDVVGRYAFGMITSVELVDLDVSESDLPLLNVASVAEYLARWDATNPQFPAVLRPKVWRIEWAYGRGTMQCEDPLWALAH